MADLVAEVFAILVAIVSASVFAGLVWVVVFKDQGPRK